MNLLYGILTFDKKNRTMKCPDCNKSLNPSVKRVLYKHKNYDPHCKVNAEIRKYKKECRLELKENKHDLVTTELMMTLREENRKLRQMLGIEQQGCVYKIWFVHVNDVREYIGRTIDFEKRLSGHKSPSSQCRLLCEAIQKYGVTNLRHTVLMKSADLDALNMTERALIVQHNTMHPHGFNIASGNLPTSSGITDMPLVTYVSNEEELSMQGQIIDSIRDVLQAAQEPTRNALLRQFHPDKNGDRMFSSSEVTAALLNHKI